jgi:hypothetical protein
MELSLTNEDKIRNANSVVMMKENELHHHLLMAGYVPEDFVAEDFVLAESEPPGSTQRRISELLADIAATKAYIATLQ